VARGSELLSGKRAWGLVGRPLTWCCLPQCRHEAHGTYVMLLPVSAMRVKR